MIVGSIKALRKKFALSAKAFLAKQIKTDFHTQTVRINPTNLLTQIFEINCTNLLTHSHACNIILQF
jgi:hypothetical protein